MIRLVVTDMDNTLYSWIDYIVPAVEALVEAVCRATHLPKIQVIQALKEVYEKYESNEYPFSLQESEIYRRFPEFDSFDTLVIYPAKSAFAEARRKYLRLHRGVRETLDALKARGIPVAALTDAPRNPAESRARLLKIDGYFTGLYTLPGFAFPQTPEGEKLVAARIQEKEARGEYRAVCPVIELPREQEKPNPEGLFRICRDHGVEPHQVLVVGDSVKKDVAVAQAVGAVDCWAEYGTYVSPEYRERLDVVSAKSVTRRHAASVLEGPEARAQREPTHALSNFAQVLKVIDAVNAAEK